VLLSSDVEFESVELPLSDVELLSELELEVALLLLDEVEFPESVSVSFEALVVSFLSSCVSFLVIGTLKAFGFSKGAVIFNLTGIVPLFPFIMVTVAVKSIRYVAFSFGTRSVNTFRPLTLFH
jgi:hypothetical protein